MFNTLHTVSHDFFIHSLQYWICSEKKNLSKWPLGTHTFSRLQIVSFRQRKASKRQNNIKYSLQCRRFWWSFECFAAILDSLQTGRIGARMTECRRGWGASPSPIFLSPSSLRKLFTSPQLSTVFLFQDGGLNIRWKYISTRPAKIRLHCRLYQRLGTL